MDVSALPEWQQDFLAKLAPLRGPDWYLEPCLSGIAPSIRRRLPHDRSQCPLFAVFRADAHLEQISIIIPDVDEFIGGKEKRLCIVHTADGYIWKTDFDRPLRAAMMETLGLVEPTPIPPPIIRESSDARKVGTGVREEAGQDETGGDLDPGPIHEQP